MKSIIPHKLVVSFSTDGSVKSAILQYKINVDGAVKNEFFTMAVKDGISKAVLDGTLAMAKAHVELGEKINE
jgi:hypothetical protein